MVSRKVAVVGGGVIGVGSALRIIESVPDIQVTLISELFSPDTTGDGSAGIIMPYSLGPAADPETIRRWCKETFAFLQGIALSSEANTHGVSFLPFYRISKTEQDLENFSEVFLSEEVMTEKHHKLFPAEFKFGYLGQTIYAECKRLLPKLMARFQELGGKTEKRKISKLDELSGKFDVVVNCTGIGAASLVPDPSVYPVRGQVIKVKAPWIKYGVTTEDLYILPNSEVVTLGGTKQKGNWSTEVDQKDRDDIWNGCCQLVPSLKNAEIIGDWVGFRPTRDSPRLEREIIKKGDTQLTVIHNYGHGGSGVTLFWGSASDVADLVQQSFKDLA